MPRYWISCRRWTPRRYTVWTRCADIGCSPAPRSKPSSTAGRLVHRSPSADGRSWTCGLAAGYATEAAAAALQWFDRAIPGEPVVLCTQIANQASVRVAEKLGCCELERFEAFGAEQWFGVRQPANLSWFCRRSRRAAP
ncbi:MAG: GNAT family N-acetyltransferase [Renibacterium sp.]|nr:GNAT family N-acetyltransferase [Renibacterium sp.]